MRFLLRTSIANIFWNNGACKLRSKQSPSVLRHWTRTYSVTAENANSAPLFVSCDWLKRQQDVHNENISLLDVTWFIETDRIGREEYLKKHLPGAVFLDVFEGAQHTDLILKNVPAMDKFEAALQTAGVNQDSHVVVYDSEGRNGFYAAARAAWQIKLFGKEAVSVLNGGLQKWETLGFPLTKEIPQVKRGNFQATYNSDLKVDYEDVQSALGQVQLIDSRPPKLFNEVSIKGAISIPYDMYFKDGVLKSAEELKQIFADKGVDVNSPIIATCWIGMTACSLSLALNYVGARHVSVYTGSITEWRQRAAPDTMTTQ